MALADVAAMASVRARSPSTKRYTTASTNSSLEEIDWYIVFLEMPMARTRSSMVTLRTPRRINISWAQSNQLSGIAFMGCSNAGNFFKFKSFQSF